MYLGLIIMYYYLMTSLLFGEPPFSLEHVSHGVVMTQRYNLRRKPHRYILGFSFTGIRCIWMLLWIRLMFYLFPMVLTDGFFFSHGFSLMVLETNKWFWRVSPLYVLDVWDIVLVFGWRSNEMLSNFRLTLVEIPF